MGLIKQANTPRSAVPFSLRDVEEHARAILTTARRQAEALVAEAQTEGEAIKQRMASEGLVLGRREGLARGLEEGRKSGHDAARAEHCQGMTDLAETLTKAAESLDESRRRLETAAVRDVIELAIAIARRVTHRLAEADPSVMLANVQEAVRLAIGATDVRIIVHPGQLATLENELPDLKSRWTSIAHVELAADESVGLGGCRIGTRAGDIHAELSTQLDRIVADLLPPVAT